MDNKVILVELNTIIESVNAIRKLIEASDKPSPNEPKQSRDTIPEIDDENWPEAVSQHLIINNKPGEDKSYKQIRAKQIIGLMGIKLDGLKILDIGCGEGYLVNEMAKSADVVWGYDIEANWTKAKRPLPSGVTAPLTQNLHFSDVATEVEAIAKVSPFDLIVLFDVVDHIKGISAQDFMSWVSSLLSENGQIFMRCHPWISRHGGHVHEEMSNLSVPISWRNKAFIHLTNLLSIPIAENGVAGDDEHIRVTRPLATYKKLIKQAGLKIKSENILSQPVEPFFSGLLLKSIIDNTWNGGIDEETALKIMSTNFIDYTLIRQ